MKRLSLLITVAMLASLLAACATPTPEVIEKVVTQVVTQVVKETVKETIVVEGTPQVVEKEVTRIVEVEKGKYGGRIIIAAFQDPKGLNPMAWAHGIHWDIMPQIYDALFWSNEDLDPEPNLVESYTISEDGKTYTMKLRQDVKWHDGEPFTAEDVEFNVLAWINPALGLYAGTQVRMLAGWDEIQKGASVDELEVKPVEVVDTYTVKFNLQGPSPAFLHALANHPNRIAPKHILGDLSVEEWATSSLTTEPVGTGPFKFKEWRPGEALILERYDDYHRGRPWLDEVVFRTIPETSVQATELMAGNVDYIRYPPETMYQRLRMDPSVQVLQGIDTVTWRSFILNLNTPVLQDVRVRQALQHALDRNEIVDSLFKGNGYPSNQVMAPGTRWYNSDVCEYPCDLERAKELLVEAGWTPGSDGILAKDGKRFTIDLLTPNVEDHVQVCVYAQEQFRKIGIEATVSALDLPIAVQKTNEGDFEIRFSSNTKSLDPAPGLMDFHSQGPAGKGNVMNYSNPEVDELTEFLMMSADQEKRLEAVHRLMDILAEELPHVFIYHPSRFYAMDAKLGGFKFHPKSTHVITWLWQAYWTETGH